MNLTGVLNSYNNAFISEMWNETIAEKDNTIIQKVSFCNVSCELIMVGAQIGLSNPFYKTPRRDCKKNSDYETVDLLSIPNNYLPRSKYSKNCSNEIYYSRAPKLPNNERYDSKYRIVCRKMLDPEGARTLVSALIPPHIAHTNALSGIYIEDYHELLLVLACLCSLPVDYMIKATAKANFQSSTINIIPYVNKYSIYANEIELRIIKLNAITVEYNDLWKKIMKKDWSRGQLFLTDKSRRKALIEIDVLIAMAFGITLDELLTIYRLQFHILQSHEKNTWYDANGRIVFTNNRSLTNVGFSRSEWENGIKGAPAGQKFYRTITDDTMPGGPVERTIEYVGLRNRLEIF